MPLTLRWGLGSGLNDGVGQPQKLGATWRGQGAGDEVPTWFLKEVCWTGSSAAREMLLSKMKKRIRLVKMESLTMRWHWRRNLQGSGRGRHAGPGPPPLQPRDVPLRRSDSATARHAVCPPTGPRACA